MEVDSLISGISNIEGDNIWKVYPDPAHSQLSISYGNSTNSPKSIEVYDVLGRRVLTDDQNLKDNNPIHLGYFRVQ